MASTLVARTAAAHCSRTTRISVSSGDPDSVMIFPPTMVNRFTYILETPFPDNKSRTGASSLHISMCCFLLVAGRRRKSTNKKLFLTLCRQFLQTLFNKTLLRFLMGERKGLFIRGSGFGRAP